MTPFVNTLIQQLQAQANPTLAPGMEAYMKHQFPFMGAKAPTRQTLLRQHLAQHPMPDALTYRQWVTELWAQPYRECQYCAQEIYFKALRKQVLPSDEALITQLLTTHSWWDSVDALSKYALGPYLKAFPDRREPILQQYVNSGHLWLRRSTLLFQLDYKATTDVDCLQRITLSLADDSHFFIRKAIGWAWRTYAQVDPLLVQQWVPNAGLSNLSVREALKHLKYSQPFCS